jgi:hypothetical protein
MYRNRTRYRIHFGRGLAAWMLCLAAMASWVLPARAEIQNAGFSVTLSEKEMALATPTDMDMMKYLMWDLSFQRMTARSMPYVEVKNNDTSGAPLTEFRLTIGDTKFRYNCEFMGECAMQGKTTPNAGITSFTELNGDVLVVRFGDGGLAAGEIARFKIDIDPDPEYKGLVFSNPDFRTVLFDMNGRNVYLNDPDGTSSADNASFTGKFEMSGMEPFITDPTFFEDRIVGGAAGQYYNNIYRPYGVMEEVDQFQFLSLGGGGEIPEPSTVALAMVSLLGSLAVPAWARRGRRYRD